MGRGCFDRSGHHAGFEAGKRGTQELCGPTAYRAVAELVLVDLPRSFLEGGNAPDGVYRTREGAAVRVAPQLAGQDSYDGYQEDLASLNIKHWTVTEMETRYEGHKYTFAARSFQRRVAATPRLRRGYFVETTRSDAAVET